GRKSAASIHFDFLRRVAADVPELLDALASDLDDRLRRCLDRSPQFYKLLIDLSIAIGIALLGAATIFGALSGDHFAHELLQKLDAVFGISGEPFIQPAIQPGIPRIIACARRDGGLARCLSGWELCVFLGPIYDTT